MANTNADGFAFNGSVTNTLSNSPTDVAPQTPISTANTSLTKSDDSVYMSENGGTVVTYKLGGNYDLIPG